MSRLQTTILFLFGFFTSALSQTNAGYSIREFTTENGLPSNGIKGMQWDEKTGFLWIATEAGVSRYNGLEFVNFTKENTRGLSHERMQFMTKNNANEIFVTDLGNQTCMVRDNHLVSIPQQAFEQNPGYKRKFFLSVSDIQLKDKLVKLMATTAAANWENLFLFGDTSLIVATSGSNYYYLNNKKEGPVHFTVPGMFKNRFVSDGQFFLMDSLRRIYRVATDWEHPVPVALRGAESRDVNMQSDNFLLFWDTGMKNPILFSGNKAWILHFRDGVIQAELICTIIPSNSFIRFAQYSEKYKILFIGTDSKGILTVQQNRLLSLKNPDSDIKERNAYYSQVELPGENVLTNAGHIIGLTKVVQSSLPIKGRFDFSVYYLKDSTLWYSQHSPQIRKNVLKRFDYRTGITTVYDKIIIGNNFSILPYQQTLYIATDRGLGLLEGDSIRFLFTPYNKPTQAPPPAMVEFSPGIFGVASCDGLILYDVEHKNTDTLLHKDGYCIRALYKFNDYVLIGSYGKGFFIWKNGVIKPMPLDKNKFLLYTHCFVPDRFGFCWISTNRGLFKAQLSDLLNAFEKNKSEIYYHYYGKNDGMQITEMNGGCSPCALQMQNQTISFPTMDGLLWVNPEYAQPVLPAGEIYIDELSAGEKTEQVDSIGMNAISPKNNDILIRLGFSSWCNKENIYLEYAVNNDSAWKPVDVNKGAFIDLNNLKPGRYKISVRKMNGFGIANYSYREFEFRISTPWTKRWWFYLMCGFILFGLVTVYLWFRTRQYLIRQRKLEQQVAEKTRELQEKNEVLEKNDTIKTRLISIISHDIVTPLKFLTTAGKNLQEKKQMMSEEFQLETLRTMTTTSQELQLLATNILNWIKYQNENRRMMKERFNLREMVEQVLGILQSLAAQKNIKIENRVPEDCNVREYYEPLKILVYNLLTNAIHFTEKGAIAVTAEKSNGHITLSVHDQGLGMTPEQVQRLLADDVVITAANVDNKKGHGLGFLIIKDLIKMMGATLEIKSEKGQGTIVYIHLQEMGRPQA